MSARQKWIICPACAGEGTSSAHLGAITADEWNGPDWDDDQREMYLDGEYDRQCERCTGTGKVLQGEPRERDFAWESEARLRAMGG